MEPPKAKYDSTTHQWKTGQEGVTAKSAAPGSDYDTLTNKMLWEAYLKMNNVVPPFGGGGSAFMQKHTVPFGQFKQKYMVNAGKVVSRPAAPVAPAAVASGDPLLDQLLKLYPDFDFHRN